LYGEGHKVPTNQGMTRGRVRLQPGPSSYLSFYAVVLCGLLGLLGGHAQRYQLVLDGKQPLACGNVFGVIGRDWDLPDSSRTVAGQ